MSNEGNRIVRNRIVQTGVMLALGLILACFLQRAIQVKGVGSFWNPGLLPMALYCPLLYLLAWKTYSRFLGDLFGLDRAYIARLDLYSYGPTLLLLQYFFLYAQTKVIFEQKLLQLVLILILALKAVQFVLFLYKTRTMRPHAFVRLPTLGLLLLIVGATFVFIRSYDYLLYRTVEPRLIVKRTRELAINNEVRRVLHSPTPYLPATNRIEKRASLPEDSMLAFGVGVARNSWFQSDTGVEFRIIIDSNGKREKVYSRFLDPMKNASDRGWLDEVVDISAYSGRDVTLAFETEVPYSGVASLKKTLKSSFGYTRWVNIGKYGNIVEAVWSEPRIFSRGQEQGPNVILISFDTLAAGHMGCYGYRLDTTPHMDRFAADGVLFKRCIVQSPWTLPSHISLLTGRNCSSHGVFTNDHRLHDSFTTLADVFKARGYRTAAITEGGNVSSVFGFSKGFDTYDNGTAQDIAVTFGKVHRWLERWRGGKFFLFVHTYETHSNYDRREPYYSRYSQGYNGFIRGDHAFLAEPLARPFFFRPDDAAELGALYDSEIAYTDAHFEKLLGTLERLGLAGTTTVVVTSDHGESFGEHNYFKHGNTLYDELLLVPLIMRGPGLPKGLVVERQVRSVDLMPTLLAMHGLPIPEGLDGVGLFPMTEALQTVPAALSEVDEKGFGPTRRSLRTDNMKLVLTGDTAEPELYDILRDPHERINLAHAEPDVVTAMHAQLAAHLESSRAKKESVVGREETATPAALDQQTLDQLKALGYIE